MYSTCIFCGSALGENESIEHFPVGRRLAFDAEKGRLWVVCGACSRWNLTPLEERWEAVEECERRFRGTTIRTSTENVGLATLPDGTELVRIGRPLRPEFAGWRYGSRFAARRSGGEFGGRRKRATISGVALAGAAAGFLAFGPPSAFCGGTRPPGALFDIDATGLVTAPVIEGAKAGAEIRLPDWTASSPARELVENLRAENDLERVDFRAIRPGVLPGGSGLGLGCCRGFTGRGLFSAVPRRRGRRTRSSRSIPACGTSRSTRWGVPRCFGISPPGSPRISDIIRSPGSYGGAGAG